MDAMAPSMDVMAPSIDHRTIYESATRLVIPPHPFRGRKCHREGTSSTDEAFIHGGGEEIPSLRKIWTGRQTG